MYRCQIQVEATTNSASQRADSAAAVDASLCRLDMEYAAKRSGVDWRRFPSTGWLPAIAIGSTACPGGNGKASSSRWRCNCHRHSLSRSTSMFMQMPRGSLFHPSLRAWRSGDPGSGTCESGGYRVPGYGYKYNKCMDHAGYGMGVVIVCLQWCGCFRGPNGGWRSLAPVQNQPCSADSRRRSLFSNAPSRGTCS